MTKITNMLIIFACAFTLSLTIGCGKEGGETGEAAAGGDNSVKAQFLALADKGCECMKNNDGACNAKVGEEIQALKKANKDLPKAQQKEIESEMRSKGTACMSEIRKAAKSKKAKK